MITSSVLENLQKFAENTEFCYFSPAVNTNFPPVFARSMSSIFSVLAIFIQGDLMSLLSLIDQLLLLRHVQVEGMVTTAVEEI